MAPPCRLSSPTPCNPRPPLLFPVRRARLNTHPRASHQSPCPSPDAPAPTPHTSRSASNSDSSRFSFSSSMKKGSSVRSQRRRLRSCDPDSTMSPRLPTARHHTCGCERGRHRRGEHTSVLAGEQSRLLRRQAVPCTVRAATRAASSMRRLPPTVPPSRPGGAHLSVVPLQREQVLKLVGIPVLDQLVLAWAGGWVCGAGGGADTWACRRAASAA